MMAERVQRGHPGVTWWCPQLPPSPREAMALIGAGIERWPKDRMAVVGSSLGGYYATRVAHDTGCRTALLNPAVDTARDLSQYIGEQTTWQNPAESFYFKPEYIDELRAIHCGPLPHPERIFALIAKGDEVLDWREMVARYPGSKIRLLEGSDHALSDFAEHMDEVLAHLQLA